MTFGLGSGMSGVLGEDGAETTSSDKGDGFSKTVVGEQAHLNGEMLVVVDSRVVIILGDDVQIAGVQGEGCFLSEGKLASKVPA